MRNLIILTAFLLASCSSVKKQKTTNQEQTKTETLTDLDQVVKERVDTVFIEPARMDSALLASLAELFAGVTVGTSKVRYDTLTRTVYLNTPVRHVPYYIDREIRTTLKQTVKEESKYKDVSKDVKRTNWIWFIVAGILIAVIAFLYKRFFV